MQRSALPRWLNAWLAICIASLLIPLLFSLLANAQQTPLRGKEITSPSRSFSRAKQEAIHSVASEEERADFTHLFEEEDETDDSRSEIVETEFNIVSYFNRRENPGNFLTQLSDFASINEEDGDGDDGATLGGDGDDGATFGGGGGGCRSDALFAQYLQSEEYNELWRYDSSDEDSSDEELLPSTLFAAENSSDGASDGASDGDDGDLKPAAKKIVHQA
jgi:hypothetical protein